MELSSVDSGTRQSVRADEHITINLAETPTTGYRWNLDSTEDFVEISAQSDIPHRPLGAAGTRTFRVMPRRPGNLQLRLVKRRSWEAEAVEVFTVDLDVAQPD